MLAISITLLAFQGALPQGVGFAAGSVQPDTALFPAAPVVMRLYTDCDEDRWPFDTAEVFVPKTSAEILEGIARRRALEAQWRNWFEQRSAGSLAPTPLERWAYPLAERGRLLDNYANPRLGGIHGALDIFVRREGTPVRSPINGLVVAAGDGWRGGYDRARRDMWYSGGGLSRRAGNGLILFDPATGGYLLFSHLREGVTVRAGDVVRRGQVLGRVGHTGNAVFPGRGRHLHFAFKRPGSGCGFDGVLVAENPYQWVRAARQRLGR
ncbi:MAG TPA: M23 family metallopeptidase [Gemmatimonadales bacterium]|nr:M23 family metallopeptidase [Gemmatimonadales bacterium]